ncbi:MAG: CAP domain-containing protein [Verrucomicrobiota bacterium]
MTTRILLSTISLFFFASCSSDSGDPAAASAGSSTPAASASGAESSVLSAVNNYRSSKGLKPLQSDSGLNDLARAHAVKMAETGNADHKGYSSRKAAAGKLGYPRVEENVYFGSGASSDVISRWDASSGHKSTMSQPNYTHVGIGAAKKNGLTYLTMLVANKNG